jgi:cephalosporin hydroxylase
MSIENLLVLKIDLKNSQIIVENELGSNTYQVNSPEAFSIVSQAWLRCGWDTKYVYTFTWLGRPIIQLPEDLVRLQEVIYQLKPDVIIETGVAHGGGLIFYASLCKVLEKGKVIGVDIEIRPHNRKAIEEHELFPYITLLEGSSIDPDIVKQVKSNIQPSDTVLILLDSNHSKDHVLAELKAYAEFVTPGSYIVATDGIMQDLVGAPRSQPDWGTNNPQTAVTEFLQSYPEFILEPPQWLFNESEALSVNITYWPNAWLKRVK